MQEHVLFTPRQHDCVRALLHTLEQCAHVYGLDYEAMGGGVDGEMSTPARIRERVEVCPPHQTPSPPPTATMGLWLP